MQVIFDVSYNKSHYVHVGLIIREGNGGWQSIKGTNIIFYTFTLLCGKDKIRKYIDRFRKIFIHIEFVYNVFDPEP